MGRKSRAAAQFSMTAERHPRLRGGRSEGTNIPAAVQAFGTSWWNGTSGRWKETFSFSAARLPPAPCFCLWGSPFLAYNFKFIRAVAQLGSALVSGTRGPGFKSRRPDEINPIKTLLVDGVRKVGD